MECKNLQDTFQTRQRIFISAFSICMTVRLRWNTKPLILHYKSRGLKIVNIRLIIIKDPHCAWKVSKYGVISGPYFPVFGLTFPIYTLNLRIQSEYRKSWTGNNSAVWIFDYCQSNIYNFKSTTSAMQAQRFRVSP